MSTLTNAFQMLVKDKDIIAAEVMHEYDEKVNHFLDSQDPSLTRDLVRLPSNQPYQERRSRHDASGRSGQRLGGLSEYMMA